MKLVSCAAVEGSQRQSKDIIYMERRRRSTATTAVKADRRTATTVRGDRSGKRWRWRRRRRRRTTDSFFEGQIANVEELNDLVLALLL
ncbi:hypothetical protein L6452_20284 [Arctium lappa]|uniref:Uncharacterized protein n=1 Tax=Arctium lappa TaxID=4217 RepID=A0ACB9BAF4_ARCLA|nr:hypothetical protein L6452_20284 [Arctium lappa]